MRKPRLKSSFSELMEETQDRGDGGGGGGVREGEGGGGEEKDEWCPGFQEDVVLSVKSCFYDMDMRVLFMGRSEAGIIYHSRSCSGAGKPPDDRVRKEDGRRSPRVSGHCNTWFSSLLTSGSEDTRLGTRSVKTEADPSEMTVGMEEEEEEDEVGGDIQEDIDEDIVQRSSISENVTSGIDDNGSDVTPDLCNREGTFRVHKISPSRRTRTSKTAERLNECVLTKRPTRSGLSKGTSNGVPSRSKKTSSFAPSKKTFGGVTNKGTSKGIAERGTAKGATEKGARESVTEPGELGSVFQCDHCDKTFQKRPSLNKHNERQHRDLIALTRLARSGTFQCPHCGLKFDKRPSMVKHVARKHQRPASNDEDRVVVPAATVPGPPHHQAKREEEVDDEDEDDDLKENLAANRQSAEEGSSANLSLLDGNSQMASRIFRCHIASCQLICENQVMLKHHLQEVHSLSKRGRKPKALVSQSQGDNNHNRDQSQSSTPPGGSQSQGRIDVELAARLGLDANLEEVDGPFSRPMPCGFCRKLLESRRGMYWHVKRVHHQRHKPCHLCGLMVKKLSDHVKRQHTEKDLKKFVCEFCGDRFKGQSGYQFHVAGHTGERRYVCRSCGKGFRSSSESYNCERGHQGIYKWRCAQCPFKSHQRNKFVRHLRTHTKAQPYVCPICDHRTARKDYLQKHLVKSHTSIGETTLEDLERIYPLMYRIEEKLQLTPALSYGKLDLPSTQPGSAHVAAQGPGGRSTRLVGVSGPVEGVSGPVWREEEGEEELHHLQHHDYHRGEQQHLLTTGEQQLLTSEQQLLPGEQQLLTTTSEVVVVLQQQQPQSVHQHQERLQPQQQHHRILHPEQQLASLDIRHVKQLEDPQGGLVLERQDSLSSGSCLTLTTVQPGSAEESSYLDLSCPEDPHHHQQQNIQQ